MSTESKLPPAEHLGDGVYVSFDGYHLNIAVNDHRNHAVAIEPQVLANLIRYARGINAAYSAPHFRFPVES